MYIFFTQFKEENKKQSTNGHRTRYSASLIITGGKSTKRARNLITLIRNLITLIHKQYMQYRAGKTSNTSFSDPAQSVVWTLARATERRVSTCQEKNTSQVAKLRIWHMHTWAEKLSFQKTYAPHVHWSATHSSWDTDLRKCPMAD